MGQKIFKRWYWRKKSGSRSIDREPSLIEKIKDFFKKIFGGGTS